MTPAQRVAFQKIGQELLVHGGELIKSVTMVEHQLKVPVQLRKPGPCRQNWVGR